MDTKKVKNNLMTLLGILIIGFITENSYSQGAEMNIVENQQANVKFVKHQSDSPDAWQDKSNVYTSINAAIKAASDGDEIWVAKGCYQENVELREGIYLLGGFEGTESTFDQRGHVWNDIAKTTIDACQNGRCILAASNTVIDGFKLVNGKSAWGAGIGISNSTHIQVRNILIQSCQVSWAGSGILVDSPRQSGKILIERLIIWKCESYCGALEITETTSAAVTVRHCTMVQNKGKGLEIPYHDNIFPVNNDHEFYNNIIWDNHCSTYPNEQTNVWCWARNYSDYNYIARHPWKVENNKWGKPKSNNLFENATGSPQFVNVEHGDFRLSAASPCISAGRDGADMGAIRYQVSSEPVLQVNTTELDFGNAQNSLDFKIKNIGGGTLCWHVSDSIGTGWIASINPDSGNLDSGESLNVTMIVDRDQLQEEAMEEYIHIISNVGDKNITVKILPNQKLEFAIKMNCGADSDFIDNEGNTWESDKAYSVGDGGYLGGRTYSTWEPIANTTNDLLFQTERWGLEAYQFDVENGNYEVNLLFSEIYYKAPGLRQFHVEIEGKKVLSDYDIFAEIGHDNFTSKVYDITVLDGQLNINFISSIEDPKISAIQIVRKNNLGGMFGSNRTMSQDQIVAVPNAFKLNQNYPNPFNSSTTISFEIPDERYVRLTIYNITGQVVCELIKQNFAAGRHSVNWNGTNSNGRQVKSGSYFCKLTTEDFSEVITISLIK